MKKNSLRPFLTRGVLAAGLVSQCLHAEFLQPVAVQASNGEDTQDALINGMGLDNPGVGSPDAIHVRTESEMWTAVGSTRAEVMFDLGQTVDLTKVYVWNFNGAETDRGMKDVQVLISSDTNFTTAKFTGIGVIALTEGGEAAQAFDVVGTEVRLVKLKATSNWGHGWAIGLAEVRFESGDITGSVPRVVIDTPREGDVIAAGSPYTLSATVTDLDNNVSRVEFFDGATKLGERTVRPYTNFLSGLALGEHELRVVATDATGMIGWSIVNIAVREVFGTILQIDDQRDIGDSTNQIQYTGTWTLAEGNASDPRFLNNDHYSSTRNAYFEVRFVGVKIDLYATVASHHGTATATIDGGTQYTLNYKAAQRKEQAFIWGSPLLSNREHVLRVTVIGNGVVTADRFDVTQSDEPSDDRATVKSWSVTLNQFVVEMEDLGQSVVDTNTVKLTIDGAVVAAGVTKVGSVTTLTYVPPTPFAPGSEHPFKVEAKDTRGIAVGTESAFVVPKPPFPLTGLGEPSGSPGNWGFRQIWNGGRADALVSAVDIVLAANQPGFTGRIHDATVPFINHALASSPGTGGLFPDDQPFPAETEGLAVSDFVVVARAKVRIPRTGDWTLGVHADDGFGPRFIGAPFGSVSGDGMTDDLFPEYLMQPVNSGDSNTRGVLTNLAAGDYAIELVYWQRTGGAFVEVYAAEGAFVEDIDTTTWALIGALDGLELVADEGPPAQMSLGRLTLAGNRVTLDFTSTRPTGRHQLLESTDLTGWQPVATATFAATGGNGVRVVVDGVSGSARFYRVAWLRP